jgi:superfamily II DNA helicase RecQ
LPQNVPLLVASATLPDHVLHDICQTLSLGSDSKNVAVTNDHPNVTLSVRIMKHSEESKGGMENLFSSFHPQPSPNLMITSKL